VPAALCEVPLSAPDALVAAVAARLTLFYSKERNVMILGKK
jgi:hypothetical protein